MRKGLVVLVLWAAVSACQGRQPEVTPAAQPTAGQPDPERPPAISPEPVGTPLDRRSLPPFRARLEGPFAEVSLAAWRPERYAAAEVSLPLDLDRVANPQVIAGLTEAQRSFLAQNGFVVMHSQEEQFYAIRESVSRVNGQPYFLTTDAAFHVLHLTFDDLLKALERERLRPAMIAVTQATLEELLSYLPLAEGSAIEEDARIAVAYLSVALKLLDPEASLPPSVAPKVEQQLQQIMEGQGWGSSTVIPDFEDDYGAYKPVGHYAGDAALEAYFRGMTWLGRVHFELKDEGSSRAPLLVTLALRRAQVEGRSAAETWALVHEVLNFLVGPTDDGGPVEYAALMDEVFGADALPGDLASEQAWRDFAGKRDQLPAPQINSFFVESIADMEPRVGWRFLGQRFTMDALIFQNLVFDRVEPLDDVKRLLPSGPDVMAALGSEAAQRALDAAGATAFPNYNDQMAFLQGIVQAQPESQWLARAYDAWLYAFFPVLRGKGEAFPAYMRTEAWGYKDLNTCLGSWAELKHDTILYAKMPEGVGGGGPPCMSGPAPGYVEPNPEAFYRMAFLARTIAEGLLQRGLAAEVEEGFWLDPTTLDGLTAGMGRLGARLEKLADIAVKELRGSPLDEADYSVIQGCLGLAECSAHVPTWLTVNVDDEIPPPPVVAAVAGAGEAVLEVATGYVDRIYVVVPVASRIQVAQGGVYSYYEFVQPRAARLTDEEWRARLQSPEAPALPPWAENFVLSGGEPREWVGFHLGGAYFITEEGADLNLREAPGLAGRVLRRLPRGEYVQVVDGPVEADGFTWWAFNVCGTGTTGWAAEDAAWYGREWH